MRVIYFHQFFAGPEAPGPAQPRDLVRFLAQRGHQVDVVAGDLNAYNEQTEPPESYATDAGGAVRIHRLPTPRNLRASLANRLKIYGRYAWSAFRFASRLPAPDVVLATIQPLFGGYAALQWARRWHQPLLLEVRDLWPDALVVKKAIAPWHAIPLQHIARALYFGASRVATLTPGLKIELLKKGIPPERLDLFPNGFNEELFRLPPNTRETLRSKFGWEGYFVAVYTGSHTEVTAVETIVRAAAALKGHPGIRVDLFGSGQTKPGAMALANQLDLHNLHFHDPVPKSQIPAIIAAADAGIMTLFRSPLIHIYFENKIIDYLGSRKPILASLDGVQADLIRRWNAGWVVPTFDHEALAQAILMAANHPEICRKMGEAGYQAVRTHLDQRKILARYAETLEALARGEGGQLTPWDPFQ